MNTINDLRQTLLNEGEKVVNEVLKRANGGGSPPTIDVKYFDKVWDALVPMLQGEGDREKIDAENSKQVLTSLAKGKVSITEAKELMNILKIKSEIEELPKLIEAMEQLK